MSIVLTAFIIACSNLIILIKMLFFLSIAPECWWHRIGRQSKDQDIQSCGSKQQAVDDDDYKHY